MNSYICLICGVASNIKPSYKHGNGTACDHYFTYCGHKVDEKNLIVYTGNAHPTKRRIKREGEHENIKRRNSA